MSAKTGLDFHPDYPRSQQDLKRISLPGCFIPTVSLHSALLYYASLKALFPAPQNDCIVSRLPSTISFTSIQYIRYYPSYVKNLSYVYSGIPLKGQLWNKDASLIRANILIPMVSALERFHCVTSCIYGCHATWCLAGCYQVLTGVVG